jgi:hypothetical protein
MRSAPLATSWDELPLVLDTAMLSRILPKHSWRTILRKCQAKTMYPPPITWSKPYLWSRERVREAIERPTTTPRRRESRRAPIVPMAQTRTPRSEAKRLLQLAEQGR